MADKTALIAGATGLVGQALTEILSHAEEYREVIVLVRERVADWEQKRNIKQVIVNYEQLEQQRQELIADDVYCCIGTTIKKAGTQEKMYRIDVTYPFELARIAREQGAQQMLLISAMGADPASSIFYSRMKGELEHKLRGLDYPHLSIMRPSLLMGSRKEFRLGEQTGAVLAKALSPILIGPMQKYRAIPAETVAQAMYQTACKRPKGTVVYLSNQIYTIGQSKSNRQV